MKFCHFSDSHLGAGKNHPKKGKSGLTLRQEDIINSFIDTIDKIIELKPDFCIYAGDLFDNVRPFNKIIAIAGEQFHRLAEQNKIPTVLIAGNHDAPKQPHIGAAVEIFKQIENLHVAGDSKLKKVIIKDTCIFALPHCLSHDFLKIEMDKLVPDENYKYNILVMHGVASGMPEFSMADLGEQEIPLNLMDKFDYTALGHFHNYCKVSSTAWYAGSTERLSQAERESEKGFLEVNLEPFQVQFHKIKTREMVDIKVIDANGKRGDELAIHIKSEVEKAGNTNKIIRLKIANITAETIKTMPTNVINELRHKSFALDLKFERKKDDNTPESFGRSSIGQIDKGFLEFLDTIGLDGFDRDALKKEAIKYLGGEE